VSWLPYFGSSPTAWTIFTLSQSASISSAITIGMLVRDPVPISERWATMVTVPSAAMATNTCGSLTTPCGMVSPPCSYFTYASAGNTCSATANPAAPARKPRRLTFSITDVPATGSGRGARVFSMWCNMAQAPVEAWRTADTMRW